MSGFDRLKKMALAYPESSPFDMHPPLHNLRPESVQDPPIIDAALVEAIRDEVMSRNNPFDNMLGECPLTFGPDAVPLMPPLPFRETPSLTEIVAEKFKFRIAGLFTRHRVLTNGSYDGPMVYRIKVGDEMRVLKVVRHVLSDVQVLTANGLQYPESNSEIENTYSMSPVSRFHLERGAYARLSHHGVCARGAVPRCYGWLYLNEKRIQRIGLQGRGAYALVLEHFEDAQPITSHNITIDIADKALRGLCDIHAAFVLHSDTESPGNILLLPGGRVVWIDFDFSCWGPSIPRSDFMYELATCWTYFYCTLVSGPHST